MGYTLSRHEVHAMALSSDKYLAETKWRCSQYTTVSSPAEQLKLPCHAKVL